MQSLRLVGPGDDGETVVLESLDGAERFSLPLDERLRNVSLGQPPEPATAEAPNVPSQPLSPREIQTRVRGGESAQQVADASGMPLEKVMRFAFPVLAERARVVDEARRARARRVGDGHPVDFGAVIDERLSGHGVSPASVEWDAYRREDGGWTVVAAFTAVEQEHQAKFSFALLNRTVSALNALAADLLADRPIRALLPPQPDPVTEVPAVPPAVKLTAVPDPQPVERTGWATSPAVRPGRRQKAFTHPIPVGDDDELFDQEALDDQAARWQEPPLPLDFDLPAPAAADRPDEPDAGDPRAADRTGGAERDAAARHDTDRTDAADQQADADLRQKRGRRGDKPRMPSWDDILLGVRHKSD